MVSLVFFVARNSLEPNDIVSIGELTGSAPLLALTANRIKSLGRTIRKGWPAATIAFDENYSEDIFDIAFNQTSPKSLDELSIIAGKTGSLKRITLQNFYGKLKSYP